MWRKRSRNRPRPPRIAASAAFGVETGYAERLVLVCELERGRALPADPEPIRDLVRRVVSDDHGVMPADVVIAVAGAISRSSGGKLQRAATRERYLAGEFGPVGAFLSNSAEAVGRLMEAQPDWLERRHGPPVRDPATGGWVLSRYADCADLLGRSGLEVLEVGARVMRLAKRAGRCYDSTATLVGAILFFRNPPFHDQGRQFLRHYLTVISAALSPAAIEPLAAELVTQASAAGTIDAMMAICNPLPERVMANALGLDYPTVVELRGLSRGVTDVWRPGLPLRELDRVQAQAQRIEAILLSRMQQASAARSAALAQLRDLGRDEYGLDDRTLAALAFFLVLAGIETTSALIGNAILLLLSNRDQLARLRDDPRRMSGCVNEVMRYAGPFRLLSARVPPHPIQVGGTDIPAGSFVAVAVEQAHHDPDAYDDPGAFDIARRGPPALGFGTGVHSCLGAGLARLETAILLRTLFAACEPELLDSTPEWSKRPGLRYLKRLPLRLRPAG